MNEPNALRNCRRTHRFAMSRWVGRFSILCCFVLVCGCGTANELGHMVVSGTVTLDGEPMDSGDIQFRPIGHRGVGSGAMIIDGHFEIEEEKGLPEGDYLVRIYSPVLKGNPEALGHSESESIGANNSIERVPKLYNTDSKEVVTISVEGPNTFDYDILSK